MSVLMIAGVLFGLLVIGVYTSDRWVPYAFPDDAAEASESNSSNPILSLGFDTDVIAADIHDRVNHEREARNLQSVGYNVILERASTQYAQAMIDDNFFDHVGPNGITVNKIAENMGYNCFQAPYYAVADNLAQGGSYYGQYSSEAIASETMSLWIDSEGHRANILTPSHDEMGVGIAFDDDIAYIVLSFC